MAERKIWYFPDRIIRIIERYRIKAITAGFDPENVGSIPTTAVVTNE